MNKKFMIISSVFAAIILAAVLLYNGLAPNYKPEVTPGSSAAAQISESKIEAPDFTVYDAGGNAHKLSDFKGKPVVINFWATWCPYCVEELPYFDDAFNTYGGSVQFLMIDVTDGLRETQEKGEEFIKDKGFSFPVFYDLDLNAASAYGIQAFPSTLFIDKDGYIAAGTEGRLDKTALLRGIDLINR